LANVSVSVPGYIALSGRLQWALTLTANTSDGVGVVTYLAYTRQQKTSVYLHCTDDHL